MKRILFSLTLLLSTLLFNVKVNASSFNTNIVGNDTFDDEITLYVQVNDLVDFNGACNGLCGLVGNLSYDTEKLELTSISALEDFDLTHGKTIVLYKSTGVQNGTNILKMTFKNKTLAKDESTTITLSNIVASDGDKDIETLDISKVIKFIVKEEEPVVVPPSSDNNTNNNDNTNNNISNSNTNNNVSNNKPNSNVTNKEEVKKSSNNYLSMITLSNGKIPFDKEILTYDIIVDYDVTTIKIDATTEDTKAVITGSGNHSLNVGSNTIKLIVKAEDESERTYTLNINREEKDIVVDNEVDNEIDNNTEKKENNYIIPVVAVSIILIIGIIVYVILRKRNSYSSLK